MFGFALNHMTVARASYAELLKIASNIGCIGIEVRNDLRQPLFDGIGPVDAGAMARDKNLRLLAVAEVKRFNVWDDDKGREALELIRVAQAAGAEAVSLIPRNDNAGLGNGERQANLRLALRQLKTMLDDHGLIGLVEPLGYKTSALRHKEEAVDAIVALDSAETIKLIHDTFHHRLADGGPIFPANTGVVHISGVVDPALSVSEMCDKHRVLVDAEDRLGNIKQLMALSRTGYAGPVSFEAFATEVHEHPDPQRILKQSMEYVRSGLAELAA